MKKLLAITIFCNAFVLSIATNFQPIELQGYICFKPDEAFEIVTRLEQEQNYKVKIDLQSKEIESLKANSTIDKKKRVRIFFNGVAVGGGIALIGTAIIIFKTLL